MELEDRGRIGRWALGRRGKSEPSHIKSLAGESSHVLGVAAAPADECVRNEFHALGARGLRPAEAGNLTAYLHGLPPVDSGWALREIERLLFLRHLVLEAHVKP